jgi:hypothetical protein
LLLLLLQLLLIVLDVLEDELLEEPCRRQKEAHFDISAAGAAAPQRRMSL